MEPPLQVESKGCKREYWAIRRLDNKGSTATVKKSSYETSSVTCFHQIWLILKQYRAI